jgi:TPR repeat protein
VQAEAPVAFALFERGCKLGEQASCARATKMAGTARLSIDPAAPAVVQLQRARAMVEAGGAGRTDGLIAVMRLVREGNEDAAWLMGGWMYFGVPGLFGTERKQDGLILFENAARVGHIDAAIFMGMAYWYGREVPLDRAKGQNYMAIAAARGDDKAIAIHRSMLQEPIREANARRETAVRPVGSTEQSFLEQPGLDVFAQLVGSYHQLQPDPQLWRAIGCADL